ncbi:MAG TPA: FtsW/RodA/SpoVE family cell cycle protein, partial [Oscillospiraceae bacterium]|nr:FtsW/RodA/SpoVE family cell cycle protein [Oscillospiraceae bacterium]
GFIGATIIVILFALLVWRGFIIAVRSTDRFGSLLAAGCTFHVGIQAALNIAVVTNSIPNTGISLPFFSSGGTALLMLLGEMGVILSVSRTSTLEKQ